MRAVKRSVAPVVALALLAAGLLAPAYGHTYHRGGEAPTRVDPLIFVHGFEGSGGQFESQKLRFVENGYSDGDVRVLDYDSLPATPIPVATSRNPAGIRLIELSLFPRLDGLVAQLKAQTGRPQVDLAARIHSGPS